ncbi:MAG: putative DNA-binding domain-containing protein [Pseudomonadota bacterium]
MADRPLFQQHQYAFAAHIRNPDAVKGPDNIEDRRMAVYRDLFYNNVEGFLSRSFPVIRKLYSDERWHAMARDFFANHESDTPYFLEIPKEFLNFLTDERDNASDPPFLNELAHYEWAELAVSVMDVDLDALPADRDGDLIDAVPILSPAAWSLAYRYPVHQIKPDFQPESPNEIPVFIVVYRDLTDKVGFIEINPVTARLLELMGDNDTESGRALLTRIAGEIQHPDPNVVIDGGRDILENLRRHDIVLGTQPVINKTGS